MSSMVEVSTTYNNTWPRHQSEWGIFFGKLLGYIESPKRERERERESQEGKTLFLIQVYLERWLRTTSLENDGIFLHLQLLLFWFLVGSWI